MTDYREDFSTGKVNLTKEDFMYCTNCGKQISRSASFCTFCGHQYGAPKVQERQAVSRKDYIDRYAPSSVRKEIRNLSILCYVGAGINLVIAAMLNPWGMIGAVLLTGIALGMHLGRSRLCAILLLIGSCLTSIIGLIETGRITGYLWLAAGISAVVTFEKVEKQYKQFCGR